MTNLRDILPKINDLEPSKDRILWRYMDILSLIEILEFGSLPLVKISNFGDQSEGALLRSALSKVTLGSNFGREILFDVYKKSTYASCWCAHNNELASMWERFAPRDGVAIQTNSKRLLECVHDRSVVIKCVEYLDKNPDDVFSGLAEIDFMELEKLIPDMFFYKLDDFVDEREVRIIQYNKLNNIYGVLMSDGTNNDRVDELRDDYTLHKSHISLPSIRPLNDLITKIVISPSARDGIFDTIVELVNRFNRVRKYDGRPEFGFKIKRSRRTQWF